MEIRIHPIAAGGERGVPVSDIAPGDRRRNIDVYVHGVRRRGEGLALDLLNVVGSPGVHAPAVRLPLLPLEVHVHFFNAGRDRGRHVDHQTRASREETGRHAPTGVVLARDERLDSLDGVAPVHERSWRDTAQRHAADLLIGVHRCLERDGRQRLLLVRRLRADHLAIRLQHPNPVDGQALRPARIRETLLSPRFCAVLIQNLNDLPVGTAAAAVGLEPHDAIIEEVQEVVVGMIGRIHGQLVDRVAAN